MICMLSQEAERKPFHVTKWFPSNLTARTVHSGAQCAVVYRRTVSLLEGGPSNDNFTQPIVTYIHTIHHNFISLTASWSFKWPLSKSFRNNNSVSISGLFHLRNWTNWLRRQGAWLVFRRCPVWTCRDPDWFFSFHTCRFGNRLRPLPSN